MQLECLGTKIAIVRRARGYTDADLARKLKCSVRYISKLQEGKFLPTVRFYAKLQQLLNAHLIIFAVICMYFQSPA